MRNTLSSRRQAEPPLIERARRTGWALLVLSIAALVVARVGPSGWERPALGFAIGFGLLGLLAIVNVALVRGLYRQIDTRKMMSDDDDQSM